jgi:hypothetical protein
MCKSENVTQRTTDLVPFDFVTTWRLGRHAMRCDTKAARATRRRRARRHHAVHRLVSPRYIDDRCQLFDSCRSIIHSFIRSFRSTGGGGIAVPTASIAGATSSASSAVPPPAVSPEPVQQRAPGSCRTGRIVVSVRSFHFAWTVRRLLCSRLTVSSSRKQCLRDVCHARR